jgi:hypothetical protein
LRGVHFIAARDAAEKMMRDARLLRGGRLRAEHGKFAIQLKGVGANDFASEFFCEGERDLGFPDGRRTDKEDSLAQDGSVGHGGKVEATVFLGGAVFEVFDLGVEVGEEFSGAGDEGDFGGFTL